MSEEGILLKIVLVCEKTLFKIRAPGGRRGASRVFCIDKRKGKGLYCVGKTGPACRRDPHRRCYAKALAQGWKPGRSWHMRGSQAGKTGPQRSAAMRGMRFDKTGKDGACCGQWSLSKLPWKTDGCGKSEQQASSAWGFVLTRKFTKGHRFQGV